MEQQRFEQLTKGLLKASEPVIIPLNVNPKNGRTAPKSEEHKAKISAAALRVARTHPSLPTTWLSYDPTQQERKRYYQLITDNILGYKLVNFGSCFDIQGYRTSGILT